MIQVTPKNQALGRITQNAYTALKTARKSGVRASQGLSDDVYSLILSKKITVTDVTPTGKDFLILGKNEKGEDVAKKFGKLFKRETRINSSDPDSNLVTKWLRVDLLKRDRTALKEIKENGLIV